MTNSYNQFEYTKAPDYAPLLKQRYQETNRGFELAEEQARANDAARVDNAKRFDGMLKEMEKFSTTAAKAIEAYRDERDLKFRNQTMQIRLNSGASQEAMTAWNRDYEKGLKDTSYLNHLAAKAREEKKIDLAKSLEGLTGRKLVIFKEGLVKEAAINYKDNFNNAKESYVATLDDGSQLRWGEVDTAAEFDAYMDSYNRDMGFNDVSWASPEFIDKNFAPTYSSARRQVKSEWVQSKIAGDKYEREQSYRTQIKNAAGTDTLGETLHNLIKTEVGYYSKEKGNAGIREHLSTTLLDMLENGEITDAQFESMYNYQFKLNDGQTVTLSNWREFDPEIIRQKRQEAQINRFQAEQNEEKIATLTYVTDLKRKIREEGRPITEEGAREIQKNFMDAFPGAEIPPYIKTLNTRTQEDRDDQDIVASLQAKLDRGEALGDEYMHIKGNDELREEWRKKAQSPMGKGLDPNKTAEATDMIEAELKLSLDMTMGVSETDTPEYLTMKRNAQNLYAREYRNAKYDTPEDKHAYAMEQVRAAISSNPKALLKRHSVTVEQSYASKLDRSLKALEQAQKNGASTFDKLLPGTEEDYKGVEAYALDPVNNTLPPIYRHLANTPVGQKQSPPWTAWSIANAQYKAQTGKELPKPNSQAKFEGKDPIVQYLLTRYPNAWTVRQAVVRDKLGNDFSTEETTTPGVTQQ